MKRITAFLLGLILCLTMSAAFAADQPEIGSSVVFGHYEQDNDLSNGKEPIEWIVLDTDGGRILLLSRYALDALAFDAGPYYPTWEKSAIRAWLNGDFLAEAFTPEEQDSIARVYTHTDGNEVWVDFVARNTWNGGDVMEGGNDCGDRLFLLSIEEAMAYAGFATLEDAMGDASTQLRASPTPYAVARGARQGDAYTVDGVGCCWWWLRSPGYYASDASRVGLDGSLFSRNVIYKNGAVRPAMWVDGRAVTVAGEVPAEE